MVDNIIAQIPEIWPHFDPLGKPHIIPAKGIFEEPVVNLCINSTWVGHLSGMIERLIYLDAWEGTDDEKYAAINQVYKLLGAMGREENIGGCNMGCCYDVVAHRVTTDGAMEISIDGGATWAPDPQDPRLTVTQLPAPVPSGVSNTKCDAASNGKQHLEDMILGASTALGSAVTVIELVTDLLLLLLAALFLPEALPVLIPLLFTVSTALFSLGKTAFDAYWTSDEKDKILCALYCYISEDGTFDATSFDQVKSKLTADLTSSPAKDWFIQQLVVMGVNGLNNFCAYGSAANSDCSTCACGCVAGWVDGEGYAGIAVDGEYIVMQVDALGGDGKYYGQVTRSGNSDCCVCNNPSFDSGGAGYQAQIKECGSDDFTFPLFGVGEGNTNCWLVQIRCTEVSVFRFKPN